MPSGKTHNKLNKYVLVGFLISIFMLGFYSITSSLIFAAGYLFATYFMGPDLDTNSSVYRRWGLLRFIWYPYQKIIPHRSFLTHGLIIGDAVRIIYLMIWIVLLNRCIASFTSFRFLDMIASSFNQNPYPYYFLILGIILSSTVHIISDKISTAFKKIF